MVDDPVWTPQEIADRLRISRSQVYTLIHSGKLTARRVGIGVSNLRIKESDLQAFLDDAVVKPALPPEVRIPLRLRMPYKKFF